MDAKEAETIFAIVGGLILITIGFISTVSKQKALEDPKDDSVVYLDDVVRKSKLQHGGQYLLRIYRQSGNLHKDDQLFDKPELAIKAAVSTFKRAKIECACISKNSEVELFFRRPYHHHGGSAEGKKVGSIEIYKVK